MRAEAAPDIGVVMSSDDQVPGGDHEDGPGSVDEQAGQPGSGAGTSFTAPVAPPGPRSNHRSLIIAIVGAVVVVAVVIVGIFVFDEASAAISAGSGTATISWVPAPGSGDTSGNPPQSFTGTVGSNSLSGVATTVLPTSGANPFGSTTGGSKYIQIFRYTGSFAGKPFNIGISFKAPLSVSTSSATSLIVNGTYDGQAVHAVVGAPSNPNQASPPVPFSGTIGKWRVSGTIHCCSGTPQKQTATASYTVNS
jgi:hypothetical protein